MRIVCLLWLSVLVLGCEDKESKQKTVTETPTEHVEKQVKEKEPEIDKSDWINDTLQSFDNLSALAFYKAYDQIHKENKVRIETRFGNIDILLYPETRYHRSNFIFLTKRHYFDGTQFYRVIDNFIIQGGNSDDKETLRKREEIGKYLLPKDVKHGYTHERGAVSMPSSEIDNPYKLASPFEFFIVCQKGGSHFLDGDYTVFGKVINGMDVVDKIAAVKTDEADWPLTNVYIKKAEIID
ncbi:peptidylprolyl isomerase [Gaetbulibacter aestuarii]|uniref:Peptidyl-prolyl cis-trans isomerase n=1 Tax=Gaetbulibacter aestuarii TaxID=1502358 RepID=A0ABW7MXH6_9FLAO